jgi:hypothetical protein
VSAYLVTNVEVDVTVYKLFHYALRGTLRERWRDLLAADILGAAVGTDVDAGKQWPHRTPRPAPPGSGHAARDSTDDVTCSG